MVFFHLAKFGRHTYYSSRDKMLLVCHLIKQDHVIKESIDYKNIDPNVKFGGLRHCRSRDIMVLVSHVIQQDHVTKWSCEFMGS